MALDVFLKTQASSKLHVVSLCHEGWEGGHMDSFFWVCFLFVFFFSFIFISWRLITSQRCSGFCHTLT